MKRFRDVSIRRKFISAILLDGILITVGALSIFYFAFLPRIGMIEGMGLEREFLRVFTDVFYKASFSTLIFVILSVSLTVSIIASQILKPFRLLRDTIEEIKKTKNTMTRIKIISGDEIGNLAGNFNSMMGVLNRSQEDLMQIRQDLIKTEKMQAAGELALGAVHQINNPLSILISRAELLRKSLVNKTQISESDLANDLKIIEMQGRKAVEITNSLLRYAKPAQARFEKCNINELLLETIAAVKTQLEEAKIGTVMRLNPALPSAGYCDRRQMCDVFMNLINNAREAMPDGGKLEVATGYDGKEGQIIIKFSDNGKGIPQENLTRIYTPFFSTKADKSGLGLAVSYNILKAHRGSIEVESQVDIGSTFTLRLPTRKTNEILESFSK